jgi:hypothetical protein
MTCEVFVTKRFSRTSADLIRKAIAVIEHYADQGYDLSLRQLYYQFVSHDWLANTERNYKRLGNIINDARLAGLIDWDRIKDRNRETVIPPDGRLGLFLGKYWYDGAKRWMDPDHEGDLKVCRLALNMDQIERYNPPPNPAKLTDSRANGYIARYGSSSWELDALEPTVLARLVPRGRTPRGSTHDGEGVRGREEHQMSTIKTHDRPRDERRKQSSILVAPMLHLASCAALEV